MIWTRLKRVAEPAQLVVSLQEAKEHVRTTEPEEDALLVGYLEAAHDKIDGPKGIGWAMLSQQWKLSLDAFPSTILIPMEPVTSVDSITYVDDAGATQTLAAANYRVDLGGHPVRVTEAFNTTWPNTRDVTGAVEVTFTAGAAAPGDVPERLRLAILMMAAHWFNQREVAITGTIITEIPFGVDKLISDYRRLSFA